MAGGIDDPDPSPTWAAIGHGTEFTLGSAINQRVTALTFSRADAVICVSQYTRERMLASGVRPRAEWVIPNGADNSRFTLLPREEARAFRARHGLESARLLATVGNVSARKGQDIVIRAMPQVLKSHPNAHHLIIGLPTNRTMAAPLPPRSA
ncbi:MAG: glycosyltransferase family 4 protein [Chloroflexi bacterium]|nr:glycosyltransferase family 4 protein [Chloroflexota bacterium]